MIQRIQSIYLLLASLAGFGQLGLPYLSASAESPVAIRSGNVFADSVFNPFDNVGLLGLCILTGVVSLVAVFLFRNRALQARITFGGLLASFMLLALLGFSLYKMFGQGQDNNGAAAQAGLALPILTFFFQWLAGRNIRKDEALVRSMDRLR